MRVGIIGLGLIGGSLGLALRRFGRGVKVQGVTRSAASARAAEQRGAADAASTDLESIADCDLVVIATPIGQLAPTFDRIGPLLRPSTLVTDVASVKQPVLEWAARLPDPSRFLGGHPVAGREQSGLGHSDASLFQQEAWIFTPSDGQDLTPFTGWFDLVQAIGARPRFMPAEVHDREMAFLSHLAFTVSSAYAETVRPRADSNLGGPGFRGMVRLAAGDPAFYQDIATANRRPLLDAIDRFTTVMHDYRDRIEQGDRVLELFSGARSGAP